MDIEATEREKLATVFPQCFVEGDNLEVLKLLQTSYYRKVKMIYIDPPYNTGNDFVYKRMILPTLWHGIRK